MTRRDEKGRLVSLDNGQPVVFAPPAEVESRPEVRELTCLTQKQGIPHAPHSWKWKAVGRWCPGKSDEANASHPGVPLMRGEDVPQDVIDAAHRGYSMHGAGLTANLVAAAWPEIERQVRERVAAEQVGWTDETMDHSLLILRMPCGHARLAFAHWPPQIPHRRFCLACDREVGEGVEIARGEAR